MTANRPDQDEFDPSLEENVGDFPYEEESFNESESSEEESWDKSFEEEGDIVDDSEESDEPQKKKGGLFNILLIGGAIIIGGGFIYMKVIAPGTSAPTTPVLAETETPVSSTEPVQEVQADVPALPQTESPPPETVLTPTPPEAVAENALPEVVPAPAAPSVADVVPVLSDETVQQVTPEATPEAAVENPAAPATNPVPELSAIMKTDGAATAEATPPMPAPISAPETVPVTDNATPAYPMTGTLQMTDIPEPVKSNVESAPAAASDATAKAIDEKLSLLITRLDGFEGRITSLENGIRDLSSQPAKTTAPVDMSEINATVKSLEQKIAALESKPASQPVAEKPVAETTEKPVFVPAAQAPDERPVVPLEEPVSQIPQETATPSEPAVETTPVVKPRVVTPKSAVAPKVTAWILRSAQPGSAMIVPKAGGEMKTVRVGNTISGLGRITAIEQRQGRWVVQGTTGQVSQ